MPRNHGSDCRCKDCIIILTRNYDPLNPYYSGYNEQQYYYYPYPYYQCPTYCPPNPLPPPIPIPQPIIQDIFRSNALAAAPLQTISSIAPASLGTFVNGSPTISPTISTTITTWSATPIQNIGFGTYTISLQNGVFRVPLTGRYHIDVSIIYNPSVGAPQYQTSVEIYRNIVSSNSFNILAINSNSHFVPERSPISTSATDFFQAGDFIYINGAQTSGADMTLASGIVEIAILDRYKF